MNISLNEYVDAERYLSDFNIGKDIFNRLRVISRYHLDLGYSDKQVRSLLQDYISKCGESSSLNYWSKMIDNAIKRSKKAPAILINSICISKSEIERVKSLKGTQLRRLAFTLICIAKYRDAVIENNNHWVSMEDKDIMKLANIKTSIKTQARLFRALEEEGMLSFPRKVDSISMRVDFIDGSDSEIEITNCKDLGFQFLRYLGEPYFECSNCGSTVKIKSPNKGRTQKYCDECAARIKARQNIESVMRLRTSKSSSLPKYGESSHIMSLQF